MVESTVKTGCFPIYLNATCGCCKTNTKQELRVVRGATFLFIQEMSLTCPECDCVKTFKEDI